MSSDGEILTQKRFTLVQTFVICTVVFTFILAEIGTFFLTQGFLVILSQVFYFPIILLSFRYPRHGVSLGLGIACAYLVIAVTTAGSFGNADVLIPLMQFYVYVSLSIVLASLFSRSRDNETKHHELFRHSSNGICVMDPVKGIISEMNPRCCELLGIACFEEDTVKIAEVLPPVLVALVEEESAGVSGEKPREIRLNTPGGGYDVLASLTRIEGAGLVSLSLVDITERKHAEQELAAQATRLSILNRIISLSETTKSPETHVRETIRTLLQAMNFESGGFFRIGREGREACLKYGEGALFVASPDAAPSILLDRPPFLSLGKNEAVFIGDTSLLPPDQPGLSGISSLAAVPVSSGGLATGVLIVSSSAPHRFTDNEKVLLKVIGQQLGTALEKMKTDERIRREEENLHSLFDTIDDFVVILDPEGKILEINKAIERKLGYSRTDLIGRSLQGLRGPDQVNPRAGFPKDMMSCQSGTYPITLFTAGGDPVNVECQMHKGLWNGEPVFFGISRDITERTQAEEMLKRRTAILEAVSYAADRFLKEPLHGSTWSDEIPSVIEKLGMATGAGRVCIFQNYHRSKGSGSSRFCVRMAFEWTAPSFHPRIDRLKEEDIPYRELFPDVFRMLSQGQPAFLTVRELPFLTDEYAVKNHNLSLINIPIMAESHWWGVLTIEQGTKSHVWSRIETDALMTAGEILGAAIYHRTMVELYQNPVEHSLVGIFLLRDDILEYVNPRFAEMFGYSREELTGQPFINRLIDPDDQEMVERHRISKVEGREESSNYTVRGIKKDGTRVVLELYSKTVDYQGERGIIGTIMDITKRTRAESALHESEEMFRSLSQIAPVGIFLLDQRGNFFFVNDQWCRIMDLPPGKTAGTGWLAAIHPDDRKAAGEEWRSFLTRGDEITTEQRLLHQDGSTGWILVRAIARRNGGGLASGYVGTIVDITERKKYEETLKASLDEKSILIMEIHHRVKNNLQIISGLIRLQSRQITSPQALDALRECETRVITMALVHESLYQSGNLANIRAQRHITNLANTLLMSDDRDIKVALKLDVDDIPLDMNTAVPASLIINELVINSLKYAFKGRGSGTIRIGLHQDADGFLELIVADDGIGIPPEVDITRTNSLGLKLVTRLVQDQLKGTVSLHSDNGTAFVMRFPPGRQQPAKEAD
ncbi:PAS domain S-box protein [Methanoregula sp. UBA64]|uniref:PAS domain S-box protein n=1 Tax=Methanoregula sp. UBA64 TaxID=1915554 RepID=UPI0025E836D8|nr:PAS domain S-box protein [Methanoregula sp. UBA64]